MQHMCARVHVCACGVCGVCAAKVCVRVHACVRALLKHVHINTSTKQQQQRTASGLTLGIQATRARLPLPSSNRLRTHAPSDPCSCDPSCAPSPAAPFGTTGPSRGTFLGRLAKGPARPRLYMLASHAITRTSASQTRHKSQHRTHKRAINLRIALRNAS
eukprot:1350977-Rhodomonas_salina.2